MSTIVLFHHVLGLTPGVLAVADRLRIAGHEVHTPDLFEGQVFDDLPSGLALVDQLGHEEFLARVESSVASLPDDLVCAGFSLGAMAAQHLLQHRPGVQAAILYHSFVEPSMLGGRWPDEVPVRILAADADPFFVGDGDLDAAQAWSAQHPNLTITLFEGNGHLFLEPGQPDHDPAATEAALSQTLALLADLPQDAA